MLRLVSARWALALLLIAAAAPALAAELTFDIKVERGRVPDTMRLIRVKEGDVVKLRWISDQPLVLHLHGYDIEKRVAAGVVTEFSFTAYANASERHKRCFVRPSGPSVKVDGGPGSTHRSSQRHSRGRRRATPPRGGPETLGRGTAIRTCRSCAARRQQT